MTVFQLRKGHLACEMCEEPISGKGVGWKGTHFHARCAGSLGKSLIVDAREAMPAPAFLKCSFCGKSQRQVEKLIAGPGIYICSECIELCNEIIEEDRPVAAKLVTKPLCAGDPVMD